MENLEKLLEKVKDAREVIMLTERCGKRVCTTEETHGCPYGEQGVVDCVERLEKKYRETVENLLQLAEALAQERQ